MRFFAGAFLYRFAGDGVKNLIQKIRDVTRKNRKERIAKNDTYRTFEGKRNCGRRD